MSPVSRLEGFLLGYVCVCVCVCVYWQTHIFFQKLCECTSVLFLILSEVKELHNTKQTRNHCILIIQFMKISLSKELVLVVKYWPANAGDVRVADWIPGLGRSPGGGHDKQFQYSCLENPMDRETGRAQSTRSQRVRHDCSDIAYTPSF